jgi:hypothetical protein
MGYGIIPSTQTASTDPFAGASQFTLESNEFITSQIEAINELVAYSGGSVLDLATDAIRELQNIADGIALPEYNVSSPMLNPNTGVNFDVPPIDTGVFGSIDDFDANNTVDTGNLPDIGDVTIPIFKPTPLYIDIPPAPEAGIFAEPEGPPGAPDLIFPDKITVTLPDYPAMSPITLPVAPIITLPEFDPVFPEFSERTIQTMIDWQEPVYTEEVIDEVKTQLTIFFNGGSGIKPEIEESIFARARDREDRTVLQQEQQATEEWATKGYTAPPGMLVKRIDNIREEGMLKKLGLNREQAIKVFDTEIENLRFAVQQGIAAEEIYVRMFLAKVERLFEVQKLNIQWQIDLYGLYIQAFSIQMEEVKVRAQVYEVQTRVIMLEIEVYKALIEVEQTKVEMNKTLIDGYVAEISAREAMVRMYGEQVKAVGIEADVFNTQIQAYRGTIEAFAARISADKNKFDAYASRIRGEGAKADVLASEARAYAAQVQGIETGVKAEVAALEGEVSKIDAEIRNYEAIVRGLVGRAQVQLGQIEANVAGHNANTQRFIASTGAEEAVSKVELAAWEGTNRTNIEIFKADIVGFQAKLERAVKEIELLISSQSSAGQLASTITAGALAAMHVGASLSSSSGVTASGSQTVSASAQESVACSTSHTGSATFVSTTLPDFYCPQFGQDQNSG